MLLHFCLRITIHSHSFCSSPEREFTFITDEGSNASLKASPTKLIATTSTTIKSPGGIHSQGCLVRIVRDWALPSMLPRLAAGGCTPIPRKLKEASSSMESAITEVAYTRMGATVLGRISEKRIYLDGMPATMLLLSLIHI